MEDFILPQKPMRGNKKLAISKVLSEFFYFAVECDLIVFHMLFHFLQTTDDMACSNYMQCLGISLQFSIWGSSFRFS